MIDILARRISLVAICLAGTIFSANAAVRTVDTVQENANLSGCTSAPDDCSIRGAITASSPGDSVVFDSGVFSTPKTIMISGGTIGSILIDKNISIIGPGAQLLTLKQTTVIPYHLQIAAGHEVNISGLRFVGTGSGSGGGIINYGRLTLDSVVLTENANKAGAIYNFDSGICFIRDSVLDGNWGPTAGAIINRGSMEVSRSTISNNDHSPDAGAGGILNTGPGAILFVFNSTIFGNRSTPWAYPGYPAPDQAGIYNSAEAYIYNSTIVGNDGGGLESASGAYTQVRDTIIANNIVGYASDPNDPDDVAGTIDSLGYNLVGNVSGSSGWASTDLLNVHPLVDPVGLQYNGGPTKTVALLFGSPAIDFGESLFNTDQRGEYRPFDVYSAPNGPGTLSDIGAFEVGWSSFGGFVLPIVCCTQDNIADPGAPVPVEFTYGRGQNLDILTDGYPLSVPINCSTSAPAGEPETARVSGRGLQFDTETDRYEFVWETRPEWQGSCRHFVLRFDDGTVAAAKFRFR